MLLQMQGEFLMLITTFDFAMHFFQNEYSPFLPTFHYLSVFALLFYFITCVVTLIVFLFIFSEYFNKYGGCSFIKTVITLELAIVRV